MIGYWPPHPPQERVTLINVALFSPGQCPGKAEGEGLSVTTLSASDKISPSVQKEVWVAGGPSQDPLCLKGEGVREGELVAELNRVVPVGLIEKVRFKQKLEGGKIISQ